MWQFIISGYIPGTNVQITFDTILIFSLSVSAVLLALTLLRRNQTIQQEILQLSVKIKRLREISL